MATNDNQRTPHKAWVLVADGRKAVIARNDGTALAPKLAVHATMVANDNPATREQGADRPGRFRKDAQRRSAAEPTDLHALAERAFLRGVAERFAGLIDGDQAAAVVVAPPAALAALREALAGVSARITAEIAKDLTRHPLADIEHALAGSS